MLSFSRLRGLIATGLVLLWSTVAIAQSSGSPNESPTTNAAPSTAGSSIVTNSMICDSFGKICIVAGKRLTSPTPAAASVPPADLPTQARSAPFAVASPSPGTTTQLQGPKQQSLAAAPRPLVCDAYGKICVPVSVQPQGLVSGSSSLPPTMPASSARVTSASPSPGSTPQLQGPKQQPLAAASRPMICDAYGKICVPISVQPPGLASPAIARLSPKIDGNKAPISVDHAAQARIDGAGTYDGSAGLDGYASDWAVYAYKSKHRLEVFYRGRLYRTYHAVFGRSPVAGAKLWEGDRRTPEGDYLIIGKHPSARFGWFLHINYPNAEDQARFERSRAAHLIPASAHEGGEIGIHGTDALSLNIADIDWTTGCISVDNTDIRELAHLLPVGTLVVINP
jgi:lipoprotein-anchoring transpeptidase ErfK/SrfK